MYIYIYIYVYIYRYTYIYIYIHIIQVQTPLEAKYHTPEIIIHKLPLDVPDIIIYNNNDSNSINYYDYSNTW